MNHTVHCFEDEAAWAAGAAQQVAARLRAAIAARRRAIFMLTGGTTPVGLYRALAETARVDWSFVHFFWGDERYVPPDHPESNFKTAREFLLDPLGVAPDDPRVHRMPTDTSPEEDAARYEEEIRRTVATEEGTLPICDVVLLGMGADGHTASLFPGTRALEEKRRLVVANPVPELDTTRLTVTYPLLNVARNIFVLVTGQDKAERLAGVLEGPAGRYPIQAVAPARGNLIWLIDHAAAAGLPEHYCR